MPITHQQFEIVRQLARQAGADLFEVGGDIFVNGSERPRADLATPVRVRSTDQVIGWVRAVGGRSIYDGTQESAARDWEVVA